MIAMFIALLAIPQDVPRAWPAQTALYECINDEVFRRAEDRAATPEAIARASIAACDRLVDAARQEYLTGSSNLDPPISREMFLVSYKFHAEALAKEALKRPRAAVTH